MTEDERTANVVMKTLKARWKVGQSVRLMKFPTEYEDRPRGGKIFEAGFNLEPMGWCGEIIALDFTRDLPVLFYTAPMIGITAWVAEEDIQGGTEG